MVDWENASKAVEKVTMRMITAPMTKLVIMTMLMMTTIAIVPQNNCLMVVDVNFILMETLQARPNREEAAKAACEAAEAEFQACTQVAKGEVSIVVF